MTVREIAALAKLSPATVYRALKAPEKVSAPVKQKIQNIIGEIQGSPKQIRQVYIVLPQMNSFYSDFLVEVSALLVKEKVQIIPFICNENPAEEQEFLSNINFSSRMGLIWNPVNITKIYPFLTRKKNKPAIVLLNRGLEGYEAEFFITYANNEGVYMAVDTLIKDNCKYIGFIGGGELLRTSAERCSAFLERLKNYPSVKGSVIEADFLNWHHSYQILCNKKEELLECDALIAGSESIGYALIKALKEFKKPMRLIAFDHSQAFEALSVSMIYFSTRLMAQKAVEYLLDPSQNYPASYQLSIMPQMELLGSERLSH